ncbi:heavy metal translocating P-type ATPase [Breznakiella homolactica]|uniref:P-type Zn(2+) transporter n=1 Tax=Breznakiella homolactica TaxID=2798577 RepID=A0A7T7XNG0_9SPIR|nr:heavy metal translocating P-type ATPase [Breznakiella homolactica]QQO09463.1 cadmium-translocating P-type ATPase [Breznakiella homolactica]
MKNINAETGNAVCSCSDHNHGHSQEHPHGQTEKNDNDGHDCAACAALHSPRKTAAAAETGRYIRFGSYALPVKRVAVFGGALLLWIAGIIIGRLDLAARTGIGFLAYLPLVPFLASYALAGIPVLKNAFINLKRKNPLDENFLMAIATIGAFAIGEWTEAVGVMIFYMIGELIQEAAVLRSRRSIDALLALKPDTARVKIGDSWQETSADSVIPGAFVLVRPGERIPLDGILEEGAGSVDASMLTGESRPVMVRPGDEVRSGTVSVDGVLTVRTTKSAENSSAAKIIELVESASQAKAKPERFISAFAKWYTPLVVGIAVILAVVPPLVIPGALFSDWLYRALILLVISCPCALVVSVPLGYFAGIGGMSRRGIMVKGAVHLDSLKNAQYVAFDKTGTLTKGKFSIASIEPAQGVSEQDLLETAVLAEGESNHPIAQAILSGGRERGISLSPQAGIQYREIAGRGLEVRSGDTAILAGNRALLEESGIAAVKSDGEATTYTSVYVARDGKYLGRILIGDTIKEGAREALEELKALGIRQTVMFTGDSRGTAEAVAAELGIDKVEAELLPEDKLIGIESLAKEGTTVFVGDGINDAPVLARADVGIAMGSGADVAVEAADVIIMTDDPRRVSEAVVRSRKTRRIVIGNVVFALAAKALFIILAAFGMANMWMALFADVGVAVIAIVNSTRALR